MYLCYHELVIQLKYQIEHIVFIIKMITNNNLKFDTNGLIPAIVQDARTAKVLMMAYMNKESLEHTLQTGKVTFYSRSRKRLWTKGEESGNFLELKDIKADCDNDALLVKAVPTGPTCHTGADTCWGETNADNSFLFYLEEVLKGRKNASPDSSYTAKLYAKGTNKIAQKVGEEAVELIIEAMDNNNELFLNEAADLLYHYMVLLINRGYELSDIINVLKSRHK